VLRGEDLPLNASRFRVEEAGDASAVVDASGATVVYATELRAFAFARLCNVVELSTEQIQALLDDARLLRTITLRHPAVCWRCGCPLSVGGRARWNPTTKLTRHVRRCPAAVAAGRRTKAAA
jgi:hypothetical protein